MLKLSGRISQTNKVADGVYSVSTKAYLPKVLAQKKAYVLKGNINEDINNFAFFIITESNKKLVHLIDASKKYILVSDDFSYIDNQDIIRITNDGSRLGTIFRASSHQNSFLVTEQCNHYCLMCSQPPKKIDDSYLIEEIAKAIPLIPKDTEEIGFTGGEPTLFGERFIHLLELTKNYLPNTAVHILTNGRKFIEHDFVSNYARINHPDMMVGIPLYSDDPQLHDYIVQAKGAFDETILGILNLKKLKQKVEIRIVIHKQSIKRLVELCQYITRNLLFVDHVALMGLEMMGFTRANLDDLWIDQFEYKHILSEAVGVLEKSDMNISIYNHQLCLVNEDIMPYYKKSISDWKNEFAPECLECTKVSECGGFFSSGVKHGYSKNLAPFK
jgi:His-Xaa-Ser system radical SAM maturase HxsC